MVAGGTPEFSGVPPRPRQSTTTGNLVWGKRSGIVAAMRPSSVPISQDLVLVGGGHAHVHVLKRFGMRRRPVRVSP